MKKTGYFGCGNRADMIEEWLKEWAAGEFMWKKGQYHLDVYCCDISLMGVHIDGEYKQTTGDETRYQGFETFDELIDNYIMHDGTPFKEAMKEIGEDFGYG